MAKRTGKDDFKPKVFSQPRAPKKAPTESTGLGLAGGATIVMVVVTVAIATAKLLGVDVPLPGLGPSDVVQLDAKNFDELALNGGKAAFVKFLAPWYIAKLDVAPMLRLHTYLWTSAARAAYRKLVALCR
jgi:hypothetical protein